MPAKTTPLKGPPQTLMQVIRYFSDPDVCTEFVAALRWPDGPTCSRCQGTEHSYLSSRRLWKCKACKYQFSVKVGSIFEDSPIPLDKWLASIWMIANAKNGISSYELSRGVGLTQKSAWFVLHRIRLAMQTKTFDKMTGEVEVDETFIGGHGIFMHRDRRRNLRGPGPVDKTALMGVLNRGGEVRAMVVPDTKKRTLQAHVRANIEPGSAVFSDSSYSYVGLEDEVRPRDGGSHRGVREWPGSHELAGELLELAQTGTQGNLRVGGHPSTCSGIWTSRSSASALGRTTTSDDS
jgi:transposase-like protein